MGSTCAVRNRQQMHDKKYSKLFNGIAPQFDVIDTIQTKWHDDAYILERKWVRAYLQKGCNLINKRLVNSRFPESVEEVPLRVILSLAIHFDKCSLTIKKWLANNDRRLNTPEAQAIINKYQTAA